MDKLKYNYFLDNCCNKSKDKKALVRLLFFEVETRTLKLYLQVRFKRQKILGSKKYLVK